MGFIYDIWPGELGLVIASIINLMIVLGGGSVLFSILLTYFNVRDKRRAEKDYNNYELGLQNVGRNQEGQRGDCIPPSQPQTLHLK